jgi:hypothetical protein
MLASLYAAGWFVTTIGVLVAATTMATRSEVGLRCVGVIAVAAGALWPALVVGVVQMIAIAAVARMFFVVSPIEMGREFASNNFAPE